MFGEFFAKLQPISGKRNSYAWVFCFFLSFFLLLLSDVWLLEGTQLVWMKKIYINNMCVGGIYTYSHVLEVFSQLANYMICYDLFRHLYIYFTFLLLLLCLSPSPFLSGACPSNFLALNQMTCTISLFIALPPCALTKVMLYFLGFCSNPAGVLFNGFQDKL